ncbi:MAG: hypothetical protein KQ78_00219 [Candidatus Izimaplasma bacterium HR2]|nr:MAG: hypothetical protein KQ78_00219 [Candidatus Izimaplasma bacterium HR2]
MDDGGYFALRGFEYQIDKALFEILHCENQNQQIYLENIQDIDADSWVMQVKYREKTKLVPSVLRDPIKQLINEFEKHQEKSYYLFTYFANKNGYDDYFSEFCVVKLKKVLGKDISEYSTEILEKFLTKFKLVNAPNIQEQYKSIIQYLNLPYLDYSNNEVEFIYSMMVDYLFKKITKNSLHEVKNRKTSKRELFNHINKGRNMIFNKVFSENQSIEKYVKHLRKNVLKVNRRMQNIVFIGDVDDSSLSIGNMIREINDNHYNKASYTIKPLTFVISNSLNILDIKSELLQLNNVYNDGFEDILFSKNQFLKPPMIYRRKKANGTVTIYLSKISYNLRIIKEENFDRLSLDDYFNWKMIYFNWSDNKTKESCDVYTIKGLNTKQIMEVLS